MWWLTWRDGCGLGTPTGGRHRPTEDQGVIVAATVVAEGSSRPSSYDEVVAVECDAYQSFYFARPMPAAELDLLVAAGNNDRPLRPTSTTD